MQRDGTGPVRRLAGWRVMAVAALAGAGMAAPAAAQYGAPAAALPGGGPVVLELYTAQGCAACPPADRLLAELAERPEVIALALHVDYWDYIGWADIFADPEHAERQKRYARSRGLSTIYTPQIVVMGMDLIEGFRTAEVQAALDAHLAQPHEARITLSRTLDGQLRLRAEPVEGPPLLASRATALTPLALGAAAEPELVHDVQLVRYLPRSEVAITEGENAGVTAEYVNIVTAWQTVGTWDLSGPFELDLPITGDEPVIVLVQQPGQGAIVAAARLE
jgi:hypothetical protein